MKIFNYLIDGNFHHGAVGDEFLFDLHAIQKLILEEQKIVSFQENSLLIEWVYPDINLERTKNLLNLVQEQVSERLGEFLQKGIVIDRSKITQISSVVKPGKIICLAGNYPSEGKTASPEFPIVFLKPNNTLTTDQNSIVLPRISQHTGVEVELVVVVGKEARHVHPDHALDQVAGFTLANDLGERVLEKRTSQWASGKMFDTFTPIGSYLVTVDEFQCSIPHEMTASINNQVVLRGNTTEMFFGIPQIISYLSELTTLEPGDIILTGSPKMVDGNPSPERPLCEGDIIEVSIAGLGRISNPVMKEN